jgi:hypothetical protein
MSKLVLDPYLKKLFCLVLISTFGWSCSVSNHKIQSEPSGLTESKEPSRLFKRAFASPASHKPTNLEESLSELERILHPDVLADFRRIREEDLIKYHFNLGRWLRNEWLRNSPLKDYFYRLGLRARDDMSSVILTSLWRRLHLQPIRLNEQVKEYQDFWKSQKE